MGRESAAGFLGSDPVPSVHLIKMIRLNFAHVDHPIILRDAAVR